jgi:branched-chain amino acid transport system ATP-binding protein
MLEFRAVDTHYGDLHVLKSVDYRIAAGEIVCLLGGNASGKSTTMKAIMGSVAPTRGDILYEGHSLKGVSTAERVRRGIAPVLEARRLFPRMTVYENLEMGAYTRRRGPEFDEDLARVFELFPRVEERLQQLAGTLSGGEQQATAIGRALMMNPELLLLDEVSLGLSPLVVDRLYSRLEALKSSGVAMLLVEQDLKRAMSTASRTICMLEGLIAIEGPTRTLSREQVTEAYFGLRKSSRAEAPQP